MVLGHFGGIKDDDWEVGEVVWGIHSESRFDFLCKKQITFVPAGGVYQCNFASNVGRDNKQNFNTLQLQIYKTLPMMKEKLNSLYALPLSLGETSPHIDWHNDPYTMESFKEEMSALNKNELCEFLLDIASEGVLECSILRFALGVFQETSEKYFISKELNNHALNHVIIEKTKIGSAHLINVIHITFKESVIVPEDYYGFIIESMAVGGEKNLMLKYEKMVQKGWLLNALAPIHDGQGSLNHLILMYSKLS